MPNPVSVVMVVRNEGCILPKGKCFIAREHSFEKLLYVVESDLEGDTSMKGKYLKSRFHIINTVNMKNLCLQYNIMTTNVPEAFKRLVAP